MGRQQEPERSSDESAGEEYAAAELADIEATLAERGGHGCDFRDLLEPKMLRVLGLGIFLAVFQQWCGINVVFNYAEEIFSAAGYQVSDMLSTSW